QEVRWLFDGRGRWTAMAGVAASGTKDEQAVIIRSDENALWRFLTRTPPPIAFNPRYAERNATGAETTAGEVFGRADYKLSERITWG
ncbi:hypothetical protein, partial [Klebsiella pneumoniae]|uniref:hypothetical protein n=1 Tax=Klebsiella pneumoniae TaxID=573 RepID=UPI0013310699